MINQTTIVEILPQRWVDSLRKEKKLTAFCNYMYRDSIPNDWKGRGGNGAQAKERTKKVLNRLSHLVTNCSLTKCFDIENTKEGSQYWKDLENNL